jgi:NADPH:quinone reductase-like Zn-dependent oxidoreductase
VTAVAQGSEGDFLLGLGAERFVDYRDEDVPSTVSDMDIVVDCVGDDAVVACAHAGGVVARVPGAAGPADSLEVAADSAGVRVVRHVVSPDGAGLSKLAAMLAEGSLTLEVSQTYAFTEVQQAHVHLERGVGRGKLILLPPGAEPR